jgi:hypothetical protein
MLTAPVTDADELEANDAHLELLPSLWPWRSR